MAISPVSILSHSPARALQFGNDTGTPT